MFGVSSLRTNTSSKSFAPLINSHVDSSLFKAAPNFNQPLLQFVDGVEFFSGIHDAAWQPRSRNQLDWDLDCLEATNLEKWSLVFLDAEPPQFHANIHTSVSFTRQCSNKVKQRWEIFHSCYEPFLSDSDTERVLKIDQHLRKLQ